MDFLEALKDKIESLNYTPPVVDIGAYDTSDDSIALRPSPSSISTRYVNKDKIYPFSFQVLVHHSNSLTAYVLLQRLMNDLERSNSMYVISSNESFKLNKIEVTTTVNHVERTNYGDLWTAIFNAELFIKGDET